MKENRYSVIETKSPKGSPRFIIRGRRPNGVPGAKQINSTLTAKKGQTREDVKRAAEEKKRQLVLEDAQFQTNRRPQNTVLSAEQIEDAEFATRLLAQKGIDSKLSEIVEIGINEWQPSDVPAIFSECIKLYFDWREKNKFYDMAGPSSLIKSVLRRFGDYFGSGIDLNTLRPKDILEFMQSKMFINKKQYMQAYRLSGFFNFLIRRPDQLSDDRRPLMTFNPAEEVAKEMKGLYKKPPKIGIWTIDQVERNMALAEEHEGGALAAYMALTVFAGIRPCIARGEITKISNLDYNPATRSIELDATKTHIPRQVDVSDNLAVWIETYGLNKIIPVKPNGRQWGSSKYTKFRTKCEWSHDVTRHTCISYWLQMHKKEEYRAIYMFGNGDKIRNQHYRRKVTDEDAERFWNIVPAKAKGKLIKFA